jgi:DNA-directed RNA polymerase subunit RPC12/RpoP
MAALITIVCPECSKEVQAPADFVGKKVRCKQCGNVFRASPAPPAGAVARSAGGKSPAVTKARPPVAAVAPATDDDEDGGSNPYSVSTDGEGIARCPECANEMDGPNAIICLHCGYNTVTRERLALRKTVDVTGADRFLWLLPGIVCAVVVFLLLVFDVLYCALLRPAKDSSWVVDLFGSGAVKMWICIGSAFIGFFCGRFAYKRLMVNPDPPEVDIH